MPEKTLFSRKYFQYLSGFPPIPYTKDNEFVFHCRQQLFGADISEVFKAFQSAMPGSPARPFSIRSFAAPHAPLIPAFLRDSLKVPKRRSSSVFPAELRGASPRDLRRARKPLSRLLKIILSFAQGGRKLRISIPPGEPAPVHFRRSLCPAEKPRKTENCLSLIPQ